MGLFDNMLGADQTLFKNELALDYSFIPKLIPYREKQQKYIAQCIKPLFSERNGKNIVVFGAPGVGKTVACKHIFKELEETTDDVMPIYVNCWEAKTTFKIFTDICEQLDLKFIQNKKSEELFKLIQQVLNKKAVVFAFDEIDKVEDFDFLYSILENIYRKTIILITNFRSAVDAMGDRIKSRLMADLLEFQPYNTAETKGILKERMKYAFVPGTWEDGAFDAVATKSAELQDVRVGLHLMREAGTLAEDGSSKKITVDHAKQAIDKIDDFHIKNSGDLVEDERKILNIIKQHSGKKMGDLFKKYEEFGGTLVYRTFQRKVNKLEEGKFVTLERIEGGAAGNTTLVRYSQAKTLSDY